MKAKQILIFVILCLAVIMIVTAIKDTNKRKESIENNKFETVAKVYKFNGNRSFNHYCYIYYYDGKKYTNYDDIDNGDRDLCIGKYYKLNLSTECPNYSEIILNEEINDSIKIQNAGLKTN